MEEGLGGVVRGAVASAAGGGGGGAREEGGRVRAGGARERRGAVGGGGGGGGAPASRAGLSSNARRLSFGMARGTRRVPEAAARGECRRARMIYFSTTSSTSSRERIARRRRWNKVPRRRFDRAPRPARTRARAARARAPPLALAPARRPATMDGVRDGAPRLRVGPRGRARRDRRHRRPRRGVAQQVRRGGDRGALLAPRERPRARRPRRLPDRLRGGRGVLPRGRARRPGHRREPVRLRVRARRVRGDRGRARGASSGAPPSAAPRARRRCSTPRAGARRRSGSARRAERRSSGGSATRSRPGRWRCSGGSRSSGGGREQAQGPGASFAATSARTKLWSLLPNFQTRELVEHKFPNVARHTTDDRLPFSSQQLTNISRLSRYSPPERPQRAGTRGSRRTSWTTSGPSRAEPRCRSGRRWGRRAPTSPRFEGARTTRSGKSIERESTSDETKKMPTAASSPRSFKTSSISLSSLPRPTTIRPRRVARHPS